MSFNIRISFFTSATKMTLVSSFPIYPNSSPLAPNIAWLFTLFWIFLSIPKARFFSFLFLHPSLSSMNFQHVLSLAAFHISAFGPEYVKSDVERDLSAILLSFYTQHRLPGNSSLYSFHLWAFSHCILHSTLPLAQSVPGLR